jgi:hypothetical protein
MEIMVSKDTPRIVVLVAGIALAASACGGGTDEEGIASLEDVEVPVAADDGAADAETAMLAFTECMREQGVDMPDPIVDEDGNLRLPPPAGFGRGDPAADRETIGIAREACADELEGVTQQFERLDLTEIEDQLLSYAVCMRENGYDMPDPDLASALSGRGEGPGGGLGGGVFGGAVDPGDPGFRETHEVCREVFERTFAPGPGGLRMDGGEG